MKDSSAAMVVLSTSSTSKGKNMKGQVLDYSIQKNSGVISAENGERYKFEGAEWQVDTQPARGASVEFGEIA